MSYKIPGVLLKDSKKKLNNLQMVKGMTNIVNPNANNREEIKDVKIPKMREYKPRPNARHKYNRFEDEFRNVLIKYLRIKGCKVTRVEPNFRGEFSLGDLWVLSSDTNWGGWIECKSLKGKLSDGQKIFKELCHQCKVNYIVACSLKDCDVIFATKLQ